MAPQEREYATSKAAGVGGGVTAPHLHKNVFKFAFTIFLTEKETLREELI